MHAPEQIQHGTTRSISVDNLNVDSSDPNWYGNAKAKVFLPRTLNDLAAQFPADILVVRFTPDADQSDTFRLESIQPTPLNDPSIDPFDRG